jgi:L-asparaginase
MDGALIDATAAAGAKGTVVAGVGNGNTAKGALAALAAQAKKGVACVRSTRVPSGRVSRNVDGDGRLRGAERGEGPRVALLTRREPDDLQRPFREH